MSCVQMRNLYRLDSRTAWYGAAVESGSRSRIVRVHIRQQKLHDRSHVHLEGDSPHDDNGAQKASQFAAIWFGSATTHFAVNTTRVLLWPHARRVAFGPSIYYGGFTGKTVKLHRIWRSAGGPVTYSEYVCTPVRTSTRVPLVQKREEKKSTRVPVHVYVRSPRARTNK